MNDTIKQSHSFVIQIIWEIKLILKNFNIDITWEFGYDHIDVN
jgi:hypothetical protein